MDQASLNRLEIADIKRRYVSGEITREKAKDLAQPVIDRINESIKEKTLYLNRKYRVNRKPPLLDFVNAMRNSY